MKKIFIYTLTCLLTITFTGCFDDTFLEQEKKNAYIEISEETLNFSNSQEDKEIDIKTNVPSWRASKQEDCNWIKLIRNSSSLIVVAEKNETANERETKILVEADGVTKQISVNQYGTQGVIELSDTKLTVNNRSGEYLIDVLKSNVDWTLEGAELYPWLSVVKGQDMVIVKVAANSTEQQRVGKFFITSPSTSAVEVAITQDGIERYVLPYLPSKAIIKTDALEDAKQRGMFYVQTIPNNNRNGLIYEFEVNDKFASTCGYEFLNGADMYNTFNLYSQGHQYGLTQDFHDFLLSKEFVFVNEDIVTDVVVKRFQYITPYYRANLTVQVDPNRNFTQLTFQMVRVQPQDYKTFEVFPYRNIKLINRADFFAVKAWEESDGGSIELSRSRGNDNPNVIAFAEFLSVSKEQNHYSSTYFFEEKMEPFIGKLYQKLDIFSDATLGLWEISQGIPVVTREMEAKLKEEGFEYQGRTQGGDGQEWLSYFDSSRLLVLLMTQLNGPSGESYLAMSYYSLEDSVDSAMSEKVALSNASEALGLIK